MMWWCRCGSSCEPQQLVPMGRDVLCVDDAADQRRETRRRLLIRQQVELAFLDIANARSEAEAEESQAERVKARYKETDHVKNYYRVNRY